jgi:hypothetical protein
VGRPPGFPFALNSAVDHLLKKEFDIHRAGKTAHPLMSKYGVKAVPLAHKELNNWRENFVGMQYLYKPENFLVTGAIDDIWANDLGELHIVDYKSTSKDTEVNLDAEWQDGYKRQMEIYQWLFRQSGFNVSDTGYFVYANGIKDRKAFDGKLEFDVSIISYKGNSDWIPKTLEEIRKCLTASKMPKPDPDCDYCNYRREAMKVAEIEKSVGKGTKAVSAKKEAKESENKNNASLF